MKRIKSWRSACAVVAAVCPAALGNQITYHCLGLGAVTVGDNLAGDSDPADNRMRVVFDQTVVGVGFSWRASGTIIGIADPPFGAQASTRLENLVIQNLEGNVGAAGGQTFDFAHSFAQLGPPLPVNTFALSGEFDNLQTPGLLGGAAATFVASVDWLGGNEPLGGGATGHVAGLAPIPFAFAGGPVSPIHPIAHNGMITFYLDTPGDAIIMQGADGWDMDAVPAPGTLLLLAAGAWTVRRRPTAGIT